MILKRPYENVQVCRQSPVLAALVGMPAVPDAHSTRRVCQQCSVLGALGASTGSLCPTARHCVTVALCKLVSRCHCVHSRTPDIMGKEAGAGPVRRDPPVHGQAERLRRSRARASTSRS